MGRDIIAGDADDTVIIKGDSTVGGVVDGGDGANLLRFEEAGTRTPAAYLNFLNLAIGGSGLTTLTGAWDFSSGSASMQSGYMALAENSSLDAGSLEIRTDATADIYGTVTVSGDSAVDGTLNLKTGGVLSTTGVMCIGEQGSATVDGVLNAGSTTNSGRLMVNGVLDSPQVNITASGISAVRGPYTGTWSIQAFYLRRKHGQHRDKRRTHF